MGYRVFILGSGFSASMGLPTLLNIFDQLMNFPEREGEMDKEKVLYALELFYPHFKRKLTPNSFPPFEEFLSLLVAAQDLPFFDEGSWDPYERSALRLLTDFLSDRSKKAEASPLLAKFTNYLSEHDVIITFNWDNLLERALYAQSRLVNFKSRDENAVIILKLHGSLNWVKIPNGVFLKHPNSVINITEDVVHTPDYSYYDIWDVLDEPPFIVPPIQSKKALADPFIQSIWDEAYSSIIDSEKIIFIGYSIPREDLQARSLISIGWSTRQRVKGKRDNYLLIDPNPAVLGRYSSIISNDVDYYQAYFSNDVLPYIFEGREEKGANRHS